MKQKKKNEIDFRELSEEAGDVLAKNGNRLLLIATIALLMIPFVAYSFLDTSFAAVMQSALMREDSGAIIALATLVFFVLITAFTVFLVLPLLVGLLRMAWRMTEGEDVVLADLFSSFSSVKTYRRSLCLSAGALWRIGLLVAVVCLTCGIAVSFFERSVEVGLLCGLIVLLEVAVGALLLLRQFPCLAIALYEDTPMRNVRMIARHLMKRCRFCGILFYLHFVPHFLLGLLTLGIFLIWEVLPRMCISYFLYCRKINDMMIQSEEYKNHE